MSFCFFWIISASFTDTLVFPLNNGEIIYFGCKAVKCIQLYFLHHQVNHQLGLNLTCCCWGAGGGITDQGYNAGCTLGGRAELAVWEHRYAQLLLVTGNGALLGTFTYKSAEKCGYISFPNVNFIFLINCLFLLLHILRNVLLRNISVFLEKSINIFSDVLISWPFYTYWLRLINLDVTLKWWPVFWAENHLLISILFLVQHTVLPNSWWYLVEGIVLFYS